MADPNWTATRLSGIRNAMRRRHGLSLLGSVCLGVVLLAGSVLHPAAALGGIVLPAFTPEGVAVSPSGTELYYSDYKSATVRRINFLTGAVDIVAGTGTRGSAMDNSGNALKSQLNFPGPLAVDVDTGDLYIADLGNKCVYRLQNTTLSQVVSDCSRPNRGKYSGPSRQGADARAIDIQVPTSIEAGDGLVAIADNIGQRIVRFGMRRENGTDVPRVVEDIDVSHATNPDLSLNNYSPNHVSFADDDHLVLDSGAGVVAQLARQSPSAPWRDVGTVSSFQVYTGDRISFSTITDLIVEPSGSVLVLAGSSGNGYLLRYYPQTGVGQFLHRSLDPSTVVATSDAALRAEYDRWRSIALASPTNLFMAVQTKGTTAGALVDAGRIDSYAITQAQVPPPAAPVDPDPPRVPSTPTLLSAATEVYRDAPNGSPLIRVVLKLSGPTTHISGYSFLRSDLPTAGGGSALYFDSAGTLTLWSNSGTTGRSMVPGAYRFEVFGSDRGTYSLHSNSLTVNVPDPPPTLNPAPVVPPAPSAPSILSATSIVRFDTANPYPRSYIEFIVNQEKRNFTNFEIAKNGNQVFPSYQYVDGAGRFVVRVVDAQAPSTGTYTIRAVNDRFTYGAEVSRSGWSAPVTVRSLDPATAVDPQTPQQGYTVQGHVAYYLGTRANVAGVSVTVRSVTNAFPPQTVTTDGAGNFSAVVSDNHNVELLFAKVGGINTAVSTLDAAQILQLIAGNGRFSTMQTVAGDTSGNGGLATLDSVGILQYSAALLSRFPPAAGGSDWIFLPDSSAGTVTPPQFSGGVAQSYGRIVLSTVPSGRIEVQAAVIGDVTGNWTP